MHLFEQYDKKMLFTLLVSIVLTVGYLYPYSNSFALSIAIPFSFRPLWFGFLAGLRGPVSVVRLL